ncbi:MAG: hypothetical protein C4560_05825 [Nitrospiraceae bacterium]|nr:MAG: hypothetical protein C4560_05825 [Nitrospiraceae bacterium]
MKRALFLLLAVFVMASVAVAQPVVKKKRPLPYEYGNIIINNYSEKAGLSPVVFNHWLHRAKHTCRLCHVDIGFAMKAGATAIKASDNMSGYYCGACHNGKMLSDDRKIFEACSTPSNHEDRTRCVRCHSSGKNVKPEYDFNKFTAGLPKGRFGNGVDWEEAEVGGLIKPVNFLEGISIKRKPFGEQKDLAFEAKSGGMPEIIFSHKKHTVWNGCELCHPEIFLSVKQGTARYSMIEIFEGKYCGVCHSTVAFPLIDCQRCHTNPVQ